MSINSMTLCQFVQQHTARHIIIDIVLLNRIKDFVNLTGRRIAI